MKIFGSLPNLEVLKLRRTAFFSQKWIKNAGEFLQLKYLLLENIALARWRVDRTHFPNLEHLVLENFYNFGEIPDEIREIPTLRSIELNGCWFSFNFSNGRTRGTTEIGKRWPSSSYC
ncbi:putative late blight resistance protein-like protein R1B-16 [Forsythia ovata]|uniref:Late blight resistance protein-like protein R1B-16 n=1 Tax=Forsythia ovata TaxID=205694 RepID=A0ABD1R3E1_9LAMI